MTSNRTLISNGNPIEEIVGFSKAVRVGSFIAVGGTAPVDKNGKTVGIGDVHAQTNQSFEVIKVALEQAEAGRKDIVRTRVILTDIETEKRRLKRVRNITLMRSPSILLLCISAKTSPQYALRINQRSMLRAIDACLNRLIGLPLISLLMVECPK